MSDRFVIIGAGTAGLTLGYQLAKAGRDVLVVEKEETVGGLGRSFSYGEFTFDIGPHRFSTDNQQVHAFIHEVLAGDYLDIGRMSGVWMFDRYFSWPLTAAAIFKMPYATLLKVGGDFLSRKDGSFSNFEQYIINRYGPTLYNVFFKPYTEKFLGIPCSEISSDWAVTSIDRAVIDKGMESGDLRSFTRSVLTRTSSMRFAYPASGGIGRFADKLAAGIERHGGEIRKGAEATRLVVNDGRVEGVVIDEREVPCSFLVWTGPPQVLLSLLGHDKPELEFMPLLLFNYEITGRPQIDYQWCYYGDGGIPFNRVSIPIMFNPALAPSGRAGLCVEVTGSCGEAFGNGEAEFEHSIRRALVKVGVISGEGVITAVHVERIADAYPVYRLNYLEEMRKVNAAVSSYDNIALLGRTGTFWYNNMDHSIEASLKLAAKLADPSR